MNGQEERYDHSHDALAKVIAFFSPYLFWGAVGAIVAAILILNG